MDEPLRLKFSTEQVAFMREALDGADPSVLRLAERVGRGEVISDAEAEELVDALSVVMLSSEGYDPEHGLTAFGIAIDGLIGIAQQMSEGFYR
jgi:hypothetical protein